MGLTKKSIKQQIRSANRVYATGAGYFALGVKGKAAVKQVRRIGGWAGIPEAFVPVRGRPAKIPPSALHVRRYEMNEDLKKAFGL